MRQIGLNIDWMIDRQDDYRQRYIGWFDECNFILDFNYPCTDRLIDIQIIKKNSLQIDRYNNSKIDMQMNIWIDI